VNTCNRIAEDEYFLTHADLEEYEMNCYVLSTISFTVNNSHWQVFSNTFGMCKRTCHKSKFVKLYCCTRLPVILFFMFLNSRHSAVMLQVFTIV